MFSLCKYVFLSVIPVLYYPQLCATEPVLPPTLVLYSPGDAEYTEVLVKREHDNLTLVCELRADANPRHYVWNYVSNGTQGERPYTVEPLGLSTSSKLWKSDLTLSDSGQYMCSAPPFSVTKYILVQPKGPMQCARGAFWCGARCVLAAYVCDGRSDCQQSEDEHPSLCRPGVCSRSDKLNCSSGRCIPAAACCRGTPLCRQPDCCDEYPSPLGFADEYPPLFEDRRAPDDYGFIQSTIYTVTACALIFMIAVVLLVSAICKMHMKRAALRGYSHASRATSRHYSAQYAQAHLFPPCYEASRLLEENRNASPQPSPVHVTTTPEVQCVPELPIEPRGLARLSSIFSSRYRQVPTQPEPVELQTVRPSSLQNSPTRRPLDDYRSPTYCELAAFGALGEAAARDLNYMAAPVEFYRRRTVRRNTLERVMDQIDRQRLTLQLGRFQLSIPRFGRPEPRPDTPNVAEINIDDLDFVRLNSNDTYTLNGRTIRLLGANFENYPVLPDGSVQPPSYTEAVRYKLYGPPPEYLSREGLNRRSDTVDQEATSNIEMPPCYEDLNAINQVNGTVNGNGSVNEVNGTVNEINGPVNDVNVAGNGKVVAINVNNGTVNKTENDVHVAGNDNHVAINVSNGSVNETLNDVNITGNGNGVAINVRNGTEVNRTVNGVHFTGNGNAVKIYVSNGSVNGGNGTVNDSNGNIDILEENRLNVATNAIDMGNGAQEEYETLSSIIDNLPAIDSDVNANDTDINDSPITRPDVINRSVNGNVNSVNNNVICIE